MRRGPNFGFTATIDEHMTFVAPACAECRMHSFHLPTCPKATGSQRERYADHLQRTEYRRAVRDLGCTCSNRLMRHTHDPRCPLGSNDA